MFLEVVDAQVDDGRGEQDGEEDGEKGTVWGERTERESLLRWGEMDRQKKGR